MQIEYYNLIAQSSAARLLTISKAHAFLLQATTVDGLLTARYFAMHKLSRGGMSLGDSLCARIASDSHPDVVVVNKDKLLVSDILSICDSVVYKSTEGRGKIYIISDFSWANEQAQNKLLKVLEEPPIDTYFVLCATVLPMVLATIESRCVTISLPPFDRDMLKQAGRAYYKDYRALDMAIDMSGGYIGNLQMIMDSSDYYSDMASAYNCLKELRHSSDIPRVSRLLLDKRDRLKDIVDMLRVVLRDMLVNQNAPSIVLSKSFISDIIYLNGCYTQYSIIRIFKGLDRITHRIVSGGNAGMIVDELLFMILESRYEAREYGS